MIVTKDMLEDEIKALQKAAALHATYSIEQYKKVLESLEALEKEKKSLKMKVHKRTKHLEKEISERKKIEIKLQKDKELIEQYNEELQEDKKIISEYLDIVNNNVIISTTDEHGVIISASDAFCKISGYSLDEIIGNTHNIIQSKKTTQFTYKKLWKTIKEGKQWKGELQNANKDGEIFWVYNTINVQKDKNGNITGYTAIMQNITDKKKVEQISITDGLTNIYNRRHFNHIFPSIIHKSHRNNKLISFIIMDIDFFKQYNDTYGHQKGDEVLIKVAQAIKNSLNRTDDYCFRLGGEEFGVIFQADTQENIIMFANRIKNNIEQLHIPHKNNSASPYITVSMGLLCIQAHDIGHDGELYKLADEYLYKAKNSGRNMVCFNDTLL